MAWDAFKASKPSRSSGADTSRDVSWLLTAAGPIGSLYGAWTDNRSEQVRHYKHWVYIAVDRIASKIAESRPNVSLIGSTEESSSHKGLIARKLITRERALTALAPHEDLEPVKDSHPLVRLLDDPNDPDTGYDLWYETVLFLLLTGNAYWWLPKNRIGLPAACWVLPSHWVWPVVGKDRLIDTYELRPTEGNYLRQVIPADEVIHIRFKNPISKVDGYAPLAAAGQWVDLQESIDRTRWFTFRNNALPGVALEFSDKHGDPSEEMLRRIEQKWLNRYAGETRAGRPLFIPPGMKFTPLKTTPLEMDFTASADQVRDYVLALFGVPSAIAMITKELTYGSVLAVMNAFCQFTINPKKRFLGQVLTEKLAHRYDSKLRIWWDDISPEDPQIIESRIRTDVTLGIRTLNEARRERGLEPYRFGGDDPLLASIGTQLNFGTGKPPEEGIYSPFGQQKPSPRQDDDDSKSTHES
jgi:HK97 family phage portal protein